jgi:hypothetical protein
MKKQHDGISASASAIPKYGVILLHLQLQLSQIISTISCRLPLSSSRENREKKKKTKKPTLRRFGWESFLPSGIRSNYLLQSRYQEKFKKKTTSGLTVNTHTDRRLTQTSLAPKN